MTSFNEFKAQFFDIFSKKISNDIMTDSDVSDALLEHYKYIDIRRILQERLDGNDFVGASMYFEKILLELSDTLESSFPSYDRLYNAMQKYLDSEYDVKRTLLTLYENTRTRLYYLAVEILIWVRRHSRISMSDSLADAMFEHTMIQLDFINPLGNIIAGKGTKEDSNTFIEFLTCQWNVHNENALRNFLISSFPDVFEFN
jgi:hypothetical protein